MNTIILALRFFLEIAALGGFGLWSVFAVPDDPSRSGNALVPVPGIVRLGLELAILLGGGITLYYAGYRPSGVALIFLVLLHYAFSLDRITWLLRQ